MRSWLPAGCVAPRRRDARCQGPLRHRLTGDRAASVLKSTVFASSALRRARPHLRGREPATRHAPHATGHQMPGSGAAGGWSSSAGTLAGGASVSGEPSRERRRRGAWSRVAAAARQSLGILGDWGRECLSGKVRWAMSRLDSRGLWAAFELEVNC